MKLYKNKREKSNRYFKQKIKNDNINIIHVYPPAYAGGLQ